MRYRPDMLPVGAVTRSWKRWFNPVFQIFNPWHDNGWGYSQGIGNTKPGSARDTEQYYLDYYDPQSDECKMAFKMHMEWVRGTRLETQDVYAAYYVAANLRRMINAYYEMGYNGPINKEHAIIIISGHNNMSGEYAPGEYGTPLIVGKSKSGEGLLFLKR